MLQRRTTRGPCWCGWRRAEPPHWEGPWQREGHTPKVPPPRPETRLPVPGRAVNTGRPGQRGGNPGCHGGVEGLQEEERMMGQELCLVSASMCEVGWWRHSAVISSLGSPPPELRRTWRKTVWRSCSSETTKDWEKSKTQLIFVEMMLLFHCD